MSEDARAGGLHGDVAPGDEIGPQDIPHAVRGYLIGLVLATLLTGVSFYVAQSTLIWQPSIPIALSVLAVAQMGVHLVFFLHITTGPDSTHNVLALAFGVIIVFLVLAGSLVIMANLNENMVTHGEMMNLQMQR